MQCWLGSVVSVIPPSVEALRLLIHHVWSAGTYNITSCIVDFSFLPDTGIQLPHRLLDRMYGRFIFRSLRPLTKPKAVDGGLQRREWRRSSHSAGGAKTVASAAPGAGWQLGRWLLLTPAAAALFGSVAYAFQQKLEGDALVSHIHYEAAKRTHPWINQIAEEPGSQLVSYALFTCAVSLFACGVCLGASTS